MKQKFLLPIALSAVFVLAGCNGLGNATALGSPKEIVPLTYSEAEATDPALRDAAKAFAARFSAEAVVGQTGNTAVSPLSVYLALGLAAECATGTTKEEILSVLGTDAASLKAGYPDLVRMTAARHTDDGVTSCAELGNSIWVQENVPVKQECIDILSDDYLCWSYAADFQGSNRAANSAVRDFVKRQTHGLIDRDFALTDRTVFALINTLYLKEIWNTYGGLSLTKAQYDFSAADGSTKKCNLLYGEYTKGQAYEGETFTHFYTVTAHGYRLKFLLPKEGHTAEEVFTEENIALVNAMKDYRAYEDGRYLTRCLFPEYVASYDENIVEILQKFGIWGLFSMDECDLSALTDESAFCAGVRHVTELEVTRLGIEGAAVTVMADEATGMPDEAEPILRDFVVDRDFGFLLTDRHDTVLFSGVVRAI